MPKTQTTERRIHAGIEVRAATDSEPARLVGWPILYDTLSVDLGGFREKISPGAFAGTLNGDVRAAVEHEGGIAVIGRTTNGTLELRDSEKGIEAVIYPPDTQMGRDVVTLVTRGDLDSMSFKFRVIDDKWERRGEEDIRTLLAAELLDVAIVDMAAYPDTTVAARALEEWQAEHAADIDRRVRAAAVEKS